MRYYQVYTNFSDYIQIDETELEKALYAFIQGSPVVFEDGATSKIDRIVPDFNRALGWNRGYKPTQDDTGDIARIERQDGYKGYIAEVKEKVHYLIQSNQTQLIGKNIDAKLLK